ncbi:MULTISPECIES: calcium/sodium antiporter [Arthrospira]|uniref:K+-dependent Na+/Ca+ exchanger related-protein n=1 Tax=Limnospira platensis NIES-46 TaxID=1236695 RepID=A0A5M3TCI5_LIMPL|nr:MULTISPECIES: calcium/sodium antiporter [Arthrospira]AMW30665.1 conjugal transfer protein TraR [Arthrospira platensis YZ]KDR55289.1 conjugal transfer protein TraR [Arthrospira platensis str. Paraca]MBD2669995.1 calcium/sodium antiporter [Arthrospira platensis FACHB-439]MBD2710470.1 calcium/sodium antiporter [Arthrospira platensis FACHB-835]MDF2207345.1 calcium/sodium antiporter [Arthrospira platensis NCB002]MDT9183098.1 calcium/sodium antiporter [Limnospira sp. PMC 289.06]MDT9295444.1 cal
MLEALIWIGIFAVSLAVLIYASDSFTESASKLGLFFGLSPFIVGVTIVAIGTSLPELVSSLVAVYRDTSEIVASNVIGSNITNIFLIVGVAAVISSPMKINYDLISVDLPMLVGSAILLYFTISDDVFSTGEALLCLIGFLIYLVYIIREGQQNNNPEVDDEVNSTRFVIVNVAIVVLGAVFIFVGANYTIESIIKLSEIFNLGTEIIAVTVVALGTSLPELVVTISAARKGDAEVAIGNVVGSNIFNSLIVMGVPGLIKPLDIPDDILINALPVMLAATLLFFFVTQDKQVTQWEGLLFFVLYGWFVGHIFGWL